MKIYTIYSATNTITSKMYIGYTENFESRKEQHFKKSKIRNSKFYNSIRKHGWESFKWNIIYQSLDGEHCKNIMEEFFIRQYDTYNNGYNMTYGGDGFSSEINSEYAKKNWENEEYRKLMQQKSENMWKDDEYRDTQHKIMIDRWKSDEYRKLMSEQISAYWTEEKRKTHSDTIKKAIAEKIDPQERSRLAKENWKNPEYVANQKIKQSEKWNDPTSGSYRLKGDYIVTSPLGEVFDVKGMKGFCREHNLSTKAMFAVANGKQKSYKGWTATKKDHDSNTCNQLSFEK